MLIIISQNPLSRLQIASFVRQTKTQDIWILQPVN